MRWSPDAGRPLERDAAGMRLRTAVQHALLSYLFRAVFVATTVSPVAAVLKR